MDSNDPQQPNNIVVNQSGVNQTQERTTANFNPNEVVKIHQHNGVDSLRINPALTRLPVASVTTASTAPTDAAEEGSIRVYYDGSNYYQWTRANETWNGISLGGSMSHVSANRSTSQGITTGDTVIFDTEVYDTLSEYNTSTGTFTALNAGYYSVVANVGSDLLTWAASNYWEVQIFVNGSANAAIINTIDAAVTNTKPALIAKTTYLGVGGTIAIKVRHDLGGSKNTRADATRVYLTIDRIG